MPGNTNLQAAQREKNDEFYTQLSDIEAELPIAGSISKGGQSTATATAQKLQTSGAFFRSILRTMD